MTPATDNRASKGGSAKTPKKAAAARLNGAKGGRPHILPLAVREFLAGEVAAVDADDMVRQLTEAIALCKTRQQRIAAVRHVCDVINRPLLTAEKLKE